MLVKDNNENVVEIKEYETEIKVKVDTSEVRKALEILEELEKVYKRVQTLREELDSLGELEISIK